MICHPVFYVDPIGEATADDVEHSEMGTLRIVYVLHVLVSWKHIANLAFLEEVNAVDFIPVLVNILALLAQEGLKHRTNEGNERPGLILQEPDLLVCLLMDEKGHFNLETVRQHVHELV